MARESKDTTRDRILTAAEGLFWRYGIKKVTVDEIAVAAEIGKGTVYLHFESKEDIGVEIIRQYKQQVINQQVELASNKTIPLLDRLKGVIALPITAAHQRAAKSPMVVELINVVRPQLGERLLYMVDLEIDLLTRMIEEGNESGEMHVEAPREAARHLKMISISYLPGSTVCQIVDDPICDAGAMVDLIYTGLK